MFVNYDFHNNYLLQLISIYAILSRYSDNPSQASGAQRESNSHLRQQSWSDYFVCNQQLTCEIILPFILWRRWRVGLT